MYLLCGVEGRPWVTVTLQHPGKGLQWLSSAAQLVGGTMCREAHVLEENVSPQYPWKLWALVDVLMSVAKV